MRRALLIGALCAQPLTGCGDAKHGRGELEQDAAAELGDGDRDADAGSSTRGAREDAAASLDAGELGDASASVLDAASAADAGHELDAALHDASTSSPDASSDAATDQPTFPFPPELHALYSPALGTLAVAADGRSVTLLTWDPQRYPSAQSETYQVLALDLDARSARLALPGAEHWGKPVVQLRWQAPAVDGSVRACWDPDESDGERCGEGLAFSRFAAAADVIGLYTLNDYIDAQIYREGSDTFYVSSFDNAAHELLTRNTTAPQDPALRKHVWKPRTASDPGVYLCVTDLFTNDEDPPISADPSDLAAGCGGGPWTEFADPLEIEGTYAREASGEAHIGGDASGITTGTSTEFYEVVSYDNQSRSLILQVWNKAQYGKLFWTDGGANTLYVCLLGGTLASAADAAALAAPDASQPGTRGCGAGNAAWIMLHPQLDPSGSELPTGDDRTVSALSWGGATVVDYSNVFDVAITRADDGTYTRVEWLEDPDTGRFSYCLSAQAQASEADARTFEPWADRNAKDSGCAGASWTEMVP